MGYGMAFQPDGTTTPTVVYSSYLRGGHPTSPDATTIRMLDEARIHTIVSARQMRGDPLCLKCAQKRLDLCCKLSCAPSRSFELPHFRFLSLSSSPMSSIRLLPLDCRVQLMPSERNVDLEVEWSCARTRRDY
eukprot:6196707-Pleurochrysis_carterae.AAC.1